MTSAPRSSVEPVAAGAHALLPSFLADIHHVYSQLFQDLKPYRHFAECIQDRSPVYNRGYNQRTLDPT